MIKIRPGTQAFEAWLEFYRGTKTEARMMSCLATRKPFMAPARKPPVKPQFDPSRVRPERSIAAAIAKADKPPARVDDIAERLEKRGALEKEDRQAIKSRRKRADAEASGIDKAAQRVREGNVPRVDDLSHVGTITTIDPDEAREVANGKRAPDKLRHRVKLTSLRDDPVGRMYSTHQIGDDQLDAARRYQAWLYQAEIGGAKGIDPGAMRVDGGGAIADVNTDARMRAAKMLARVDARLGHMGADMVRKVLGGMEIKKVAAIYGDANARGCDRLGWFFRQCLDQMVTATGTVVRGADRARVAAVAIERAADAPRGDIGQARPIEPSKGEDAAAIAARHAGRMRDTVQATTRDNREAGKRVKPNDHA